MQSVAKLKITSLLFCAVPLFFLNNMILWGGHCDFTSYWPDDGV